MNITRRETLSVIGAAALLPSLSSLAHAAGDAGQAGPVIATNVYPWTTFAHRQGESLGQHSDELLAAIASTGIRGYEPVINDTAELAGLGERLGRHGMEMRSLYVNSVLHDEAQVDANVKHVLAIARAARDLGCQIIVTNPAPVRWGGPEDKNDAQLRAQAKALDRLGAELRGLGLALAYHNHDAELRQGAREFHHMLTGTDPANVRFCFDAHWIFRACGNSEVAVFDVLALYRDRITEIHLRQSTQGVWDEVFKLSGDIDYERLLRSLHEHGQSPLLVLEQAVEAGSPSAHTAVEAHRAGYQNLREFLAKQSV
jgi:inosose dehydratase